MKPLLLATLVAMVLLSGVTGAGAYKLIGHGTSSCGSWTAERRDRTAAGAQQWVVGFLSGVGWGTEGYDPLAGVDADAVWAWTDNYCREHPLENLGVAAAAFAQAHPK